MSYRTRLGKINKEKAKASRIWSVENIDHENLNYVNPYGYEEFFEIDVYHKQLHEYMTD